MFTYERYAVIQPGITEEGITVNGEEKALNYLDLITEEEYLDVLESLPKENQQLDDEDPQKFIAKMGGDAVRDLLNRINLDKTAGNLRHKAATETSQQRKAEALKRLSVVEAFRSGNLRKENRPEWMIVEYLPVVPPGVETIGAIGWWTLCKFRFE